MLDGWIKLPTIDFVPGKDGPEWGTVTYRRVRLVDVAAWEEYKMDDYQKRNTNFPVTKMVIRQPLVHLTDKKGNPFAPYKMVCVQMTPEQVDKLFGIYD